jgi:hypothetical protein
VRNFVFDVAFENGFMKKISVPIALYSPSLLHALDMVGFFFGKEVLMLVMKALL